MKMMGCLLAFVLTCRVAHAADDRLCIQSRATGIAHELEGAKRLNTLIEQVPPDESRYLENEYGAASLQGSAARMRLLYERPCYRAWSIHKSLDGLERQLESVEAPFPGEDLSVAKIKSAAFAIVKADQSAREFSDYVRFDQSRQPHVLSQEQIDQHTFSLGTMGTTLATFVSCTADTLTPTKATK
jgi:hypothetical protein